MSWMSDESPAYQLRQSAKTFVAKARAREQDAVNSRMSAAVADEEAKKLRAQAKLNEEAAVQLEANRSAS